MSRVDGGDCLRHGALELSVTPSYGVRRVEEGMADMWKRLVTSAAFSLLTSCGSSDKDPNSPFETANSKDVGFLLDFENNEPCQNNDIDDAMSSIHKYNLSILTLDGYGGEGYGSFNVSKKVIKVEGEEFVSYFIPLTGKWHDSGLNILGVIASTCGTACGYWNVSYYFKEDAQTLLKSLKKMNIKYSKSLKISQELNIGSKYGDAGGPYFSIDTMSDYTKEPLYMNTEFGRTLLKTSQSIMSCIVSV